MSFQLPVYRTPDFTEDRFVQAPNAAMAPAPLDGVAPEGFHSTGIDPVYFKIAGEDITYIQVPVKVEGEYNSNVHEVNFTYSL